MTEVTLCFIPQLLQQGQHLNLTGKLDWERGTSGPQQVILHSGLVFNQGTVTGHMTFNLPMVEGWENNKAELFYETREERHWFK